MTYGVGERDGAVSRNGHFIDIDNNSIRKPASLRSLACLYGSKVSLTHRSIGSRSASPYFYKWPLQLRHLSSSPDSPRLFVFLYFLLELLSLTWVSKLSVYNRAMARRSPGKEVLPPMLLGFVPELTFECCRQGQDKLHRHPPRWQEVRLER